jgi:hypothetical protein
VDEEGVIIVVPMEVIGSGSSEEDVPSFSVLVRVVRGMRSMGREYLQQLVIGMGFVLARVGVPEDAKAGES